MDQKANYASAKQKQQKPFGVGRASIEPVTIEQVDMTEVEHSGDQEVQVEPPRLTALVSVSRNLNPFALDSEFQQHVNLRDVLLAASGANLDILEAVSALQARKWAYANAMTAYLPTANLGFNEIGLNSKVQLPLKSTGVFPGSFTPITAQISQIALATPLTILNSGFVWTLIQGGRLLAAIQSQRHQLHAAKASLRSDISNTLLVMVLIATGLDLQRGVIANPSGPAVNTSLEQVKHNTSLFKHGQATALDVLEAKAQLAKDRQNLLDQQRIRRGAAIKLAHVLNSILDKYLIPAETVLRKVRFISSDVAVNQLLAIAIDNRPELKQYEELRLAARQQIKTARADLLPSVF